MSQAKLALLRRWRRRLGLEANPLRRRCDVVEAWLALGIVALVVVAAPVAAVLAARGAYDAGLHAERTQAATRHRTAAVLLTDVPTGGTRTAGARVAVPARWMGPDGREHTGRVLGLPGSRAGDVQEIWVDRSGRAVDPPLRREQTRYRAAVAAVVSVFGTAAVGWIAVAVTGRLFLHRRLAEWEAAWSAVEPQWTGRR